MILVLAGFAHASVWEILKIMIFLTTTSIVYNGIFKPERHSDLRTRAGVNLVYFFAFLFFPLGDLQLGWWSLNGILYVWSRLATILFGVAVILYLLAWKRRHQWVSSATLGGNGIEPMVLTLSLRGPVYQSVGDEATEGAIRLV